jgi:hypothetical protein
MPASLRAAPEQRLQLAALQHRADEDPAHVAQEAHRLDREMELVIVLLPGRLEDGPLEAGVLRLRRREGGEVVRPGQQRRRRVEGSAVERLRPPQGPADLEGRAHAAPQQR